MSIELKIDSHLSEERLKLVVPWVSSDRLQRRLYLTKELHDEVYGEEQNSRESEMFANLIADLEVFVTSDTIDPDYLRQLAPPKEGVWEIRSTRSFPQIRVFGVFAFKDCFIGTHYRHRDNLKGKQWQKEIKLTKDIWNRLFTGYTHKKSSSRNQLFTGALDEQYFTQ